jgi:hypothetical protein
VGRAGIVGRAVELAKAGLRCQRTTPDLEELFLELVNERRKLPKSLNLRMCVV